MRQKSAPGQLGHLASAWGTAEQHGDDGAAGVRLDDRIGDETLSKTTALISFRASSRLGAPRGRYDGGNPMRQKARKPEKPERNHHIIGVLAHQAHVDGSRLFPCTQCRRQVWMSPASQRLLATGKWGACCMECGEAAIASGEEFAGVAPGAVEEFYGWLQRN